MWKTPHYLLTINSEMKSSYRHRSFPFPSHSNTQPKHLPSRKVIKKRRKAHYFLESKPSVIDISRYNYKRLENVWKRKSKGKKENKNKINWKTIIYIFSNYIFILNKIILTPEIIFTLGWLNEWAWSHAWYSMRLQVRGGGSNSEYMRW